MKFRIGRRQKGAALVEYGLLVAGVALVATAAVAIFGTKTADLIASIATVLPGAHSSENGPIKAGKLVETTAGTSVSPSSNPIQVDVPTILTNSGSKRLDTNLGVNVDTLIITTNY